jgi:TetR/AcrR family tetracycline transcriptional repressor
MTAQPAERGQVSRELVVETAQRLVEENDLSALTMRRLAAELGTAVTAIYWHVGNRDALLDLLVDRLLLDLRAAVEVSGRTPRERIAAIVRAWRQRLWEHPHLIGVAHERGKTATMFHPMQAHLATELGALGLKGRDAAPAIKALQHHVASSVLMQRTAERGPVSGVTDPAAWPADCDRDLVAALSDVPDHEAMFELGLAALLDRLLPR